MVFKAPDGGAAENVVQLAQGLPRHGWELELVGPLSASIYDRIPASIPVHRLPFTPGYGPPNDDIAALRGLIALSRRGNYDLLHAHSAQPSVLARLARLWGAPPVVYTAHCFPFVGNISRRRLITGLVIEWPLAPLTSAFIDVSEFERRAALSRRVGTPERHHLIRNACAPCPDVDPDPELLRFRGEGPLVLVVTALRADKRVDVFLRSLTEVFREVPQARAAVVGNGPESSAFVEVARKLGLDQDGRLLMVPFEGPSARYLKCADVYVLPSSFESLPIGLLEAIACGVPQVATAVGGVTEAVVEETGVTVPPGDAAALARALIPLLREPERRERMGRASRIRHAELFDLSRMVAETAAVYEAALAAER
jgi:glycosyltransferase involved in cell wall biosynthesis